MNNHKILLSNRYGDKNYLVPINETDFKIEFDKRGGGSLNVGYSDSERKILKFIDPSGGPMISVGDKIIPNFKIKEIVFDNGWILKCKKYDISRNKKPRTISK